MLDEIFAKYLASHGYSDHTQWQYRSIARSFVMFVGQRRVRAATSATVERFMARGGGWSQRRALPALRCFFEALRKKALVKTNPAERVAAASKPPTFSAHELRLLGKTNRKTGQPTMEAVLAGALGDTPKADALRDYLCRHYRYSRALLDAVRAKRGSRL